MLIRIARISFQLKITKIVYICNCTWILMLSNVLIFQNIKGAGSSSTQNVCHLRILSLFHLLLQGWFLCCHYIQPNGEHNCFKAKMIAWPGKSWVLIPLLVRSNKSLSWRNQLAKNQTNHIHPQFNQKALAFNNWNLVNEVWQGHPICGWLPGPIPQLSPFVHIVWRGVE